MTKKGITPLAFDEMMNADNSPRQPYSTYNDWYAAQDKARLIAKSREAENIFRKTGITFAVYGHADSSEKLIPFDLIPRIISGREWRKLAQGIEQRVIALNAFLDDIYHKQEIIKAGRVPRELIERNVAFLPRIDRLHGRRVASIPILSEPTSCAPAKTSSTFWKTMPAPRPVSATCWKTARR